MKRREYGDHLQDIQDAIAAIEGFVAGFTPAAFRKDLKTILATVKAIEIIGEATKKLPAGIRDKYPDVPWQQMSGMRDKLVHEYFGIELGVLWQTVKRDIPRLKPLIARVLKDFDQPTVIPRFRQTPLARSGKGAPGARSG